jgi:hypothetical protein
MMAISAIIIIIVDGRDAMVAIVVVAVLPATGSNGLANKKLDTNSFS